MKRALKWGMAALTMGTAPSRNAVAAEKCATEVVTVGFIPKLDTDRIPGSQGGRRGSSEGDWREGRAAGAVSGHSGGADRIHQ